MELKGLIGANVGLIIDINSSKLILIHINK